MGKKSKSPLEKKLVNNLPKELFFFKFLKKTVDEQFWKIFPLNNSS